MRVFLDTNVILSGFATRGLCFDVLELVLAHLDFEFVTGEVILDEVARVAARKFKSSPHRVQRLLEILSEYHVEPLPVSLPLVDIRDKSDLPVLASALAAGADVLVTGDKDLLELREKVPGLEILDPRTFWTKYRAD
ncbi:MAG TPA: putative toxin-antitoxin system toxin component, PIN family [Longimicrobium sp.]